MKISEIWIYPIKSCGGIRLREWDLLQTGLRWDRQWMIVDPDGKFITQREHPEMARILTREHGGELYMSIEGTELRLEGPSDQLVSSQVWSSQVRASLEKNLGTHQLLSDFMKRPVQLVTAGPVFRRAVPEREAPASRHTFFADSHPLLVATMPSLEDLNTRLKEAVPMSRFRPNLVVSGELAPYAEDQWDRVRMGDHVIENRKMCSRCPIITIDQDLGVKKGPEPLATLAKYKRSGTKVYFGVRAWSESEGRIREGDSVQVLSSKEG